MEKAIVLLQIQKVPPAEAWTLDPGWVIAFLIGVVGILLVRILNKVEKRLEVHDDKIERHEIRLTIIEKKEVEH